VMPEGEIVGRILKESFNGNEERRKWSFKRATGTPTRWARWLSAKSR